MHGSALVEAAAGLAAVMLAGLVLIEACHWQLMRQLAYVALLEAARAGATAHAHPRAMAAAFETALLPRYAAPDHTARQRLQAALARAALRSGMPAWHIQVLSPDAAAYADFSQPGLQIQGASGLPAIRNDRQAEQHARHLARGWPGGRGPRSGLSLHEANLLRLRLRYLVEPLAPPTALLLRAAAWASAWPGCSRDALAAGMLPLRLDLTMDMQSHPVLWPDEGNAGVSRGAGC